uniref:Choline/carnitine acyltransferase domain-containing protein n=2 Tax=Lutzomyia longipalpis TaxID=7200 RepID=A0A1B0CL54_LUTLO
MLRTSAVATRRCFSTRPDGDYQFLHRSKIPMLHFQKSLPRLPIPELQNTCRKYLAALSPLLTAEAHARTAGIVKDFEGGIGRDLQERLKVRDSVNQHTSYISDPWFEMYITDRAPLPVNYTPLLGMKYPSTPPPTLPVQTANILITTARFLRALRAEYLTPEIFHMNAKTADSAFYQKIVQMVPQRFATYTSYAFKSFPLDMSQYQGLFSATRIPRQGKDRIFRAPKDPRHVVVLRKGNIYRLDVLDRDGNIEVPESLSEKNRRGMEIVDSGIICLCLDDLSYGDLDVAARTRDHLYANGPNRWFDKSISVVVSSDARTTVQFEHSWGDGVAVLRYFNEVFKEISERPFITEGTVAQAPGDEAVEKLSFDLDDKMKTGIDEAKKRHKAVEDSLDINYMQSELVGKKLCKSAKISPDSMAQFAIQLAYAYLTGGTTATYESCSTAAFRCGRTETVRPATEATKKLCQVLLNKGPNDAATAEEVAMLRECSNRHNQLTKEAAMGQGFDRHLFALKDIAKSQGMALPDLYNDPAYALINHNVLSTSTLSTPAIEVGGFGPVVPDGYGIGYVIDAQRLGSIVTTYRAKRNGKEFVEALEKAAKEIRKILDVASKEGTK